MNTSFFASAATVALIATAMTGCAAQKAEMKAETAPVAAAAADKKPEGSCGGAKNADGSAKAADGSCGEGSCGAAPKR